MGCFSEKGVVEVWQRLLWDRVKLVTEDGEPVKVIYPGRINDGMGADLCDAVIATGHGLVKGDIEIHVRTSDWWRHQHHQSVAYNRVILHVVWQHDAKMATNLQNGKRVPVLALSRYAGSPVSRSSVLLSSPAYPGMPCRKIPRHWSGSTVARFLDMAGEERFLAKAAQFQSDLVQTEPGQSLYQGIMGALGYSRNKLSFIELARRLPLKVLESVAQSEISDEECLAWQQALLLGSAGFLPSQRPRRGWEKRSDAPWVDKLVRLWASFSHAEAMNSNVWYLFRVRPNNSPLRRLVAMSYLLTRYRERGILEGLVKLVEGVPVTPGHHRLAKGLFVTADGYGAGHFDSGSGSRRKSQTLLGHGRASDIIVNVLLPFIFTWGEFTSRLELAKKAWQLYRRCPGLAGNSLEKHMRKQLGLSGELVNSARRQQGLIHIYNNFCIQGRCQECRLSHPETGNHIQV